MKPEDNPLANLPIDSLRNPLYIWQLYVRARNADEPMPDVVLEYFDGCAEGVTEMMMAAPIKGPFKNWSTKFAKAMCMTPEGGNRQGNCFTQYKRAYLQRMALLEAGNRTHTSWAAYDRKMAKRTSLTVDQVREAREAVFKQVAGGKKMITPLKADQLQAIREILAEEDDAAKKAKERKQRIEKILEDL